LIVLLATACAFAGPANCRTLGGEPPRTKVPQARPCVDSVAESWGWELAGLRTRLVPLEKQFVLGQPMKFRLELKNFGQGAVRYDSQGVGLNGSLLVRDPQGRPVRYIGGSFQTMGQSPLPSLAPGKTAVLFDALDLASQYLVVRPGRYTVQFRGISNETEAKAQEESRRRISEAEAKDTGEKIDWWGALLPQSNAAAIDVQPGTVPAVKRIAVRLLDVLPKDWELSVHGYRGEVNCPPAWETTPPGWDAGRLMPSVTLARSVTGYIDDIVRAELWLADCKLHWTGEVGRPGQRAAVYLGKCPEGYIYADLPSHPEAQAAKWSTLQEDIPKALQAVPEKFFCPTDGVKDDGDLELTKLAGLDKLYFANSKITDVGLKRLEGLAQVEEMYLSGTRVTDAGLEHLKGLTRLQVLALSDTQITDAGLAHLKGLAQLQRLMLDDTQITDAGLAHLTGLARLRWLRLNGTGITDHGLEHLKGLHQLEVLSLTDTKITDVGLAHLKELARLEVLSLTNTQVTDAGLEHLKGLLQLKQLYLDRTHIADAGVKKLQQALPKCRIYWEPPTSDERQRRAAPDQPGG
jgi:hypothetical protein